MRECNPRQRLHEWVPRRPLVQQQPQNCPPRGNVEYYEVKPHFRSRHRYSPQHSPQRAYLDQRIMISLLAAVTDVSALITFASSRLPAVPSVARAATPMPATMLAQISDTATILRWVIRSALKMDVLFMTLPQSLDFASSLLHRARIRFTALFFGVTSRACSAFPAGAGGGGWGGFRVRLSMLPRPAEARLKWYGKRQSTRPCCGNKGQRRASS